MRPGNGRDLLQHRLVSAVLPAAAAGKGNLCLRSKEVDFAPELELSHRKGPTEIGLREIEEDTCPTRRGGTRAAIRQVTCLSPDQWSSRSGRSCGSRSDSCGIGCCP